MQNSVASEASTAGRSPSFSTRKRSRNSFMAHDLGGQVCSWTFTAGEPANNQAERDSQPDANGQLMCRGADARADRDVDSKPDSGLHGGSRVTPSLWVPRDRLL